MLSWHQRGSDKHAIARPHMNVVHGLLSSLVSIFERRNPEALLEREQERFRALIGQFNQGLVTHATLVERLKSAVSVNERKPNRP